MQEGYVEVTGIPTHIFTWGKWIEEPLGPDVKEICICITGNPGLPGFYTTFGRTIYESLDEKVPVWVIGMTGHDNPPRKLNMKIPDYTGNERLYNLSGQVFHKAEFILKYVPEHVKIHLMGHSIGAYVALELLKRPSIKKRVQKEYLLFPTVERLGASPNGRLFQRCFPMLTWLALGIFWLFTLLPTIARIPFIYIYFLFTRIPKYFIGTAIKYARPSVVHKVINLACEEMKVVDELDAALIEENQHLLKLYYGARDDWAPVSYYENLVKRFPKIDAEVCKRGMPHAFCLRNGPEMGYIVSEWIKEFRAI